MMNEFNPKERTLARENILKILYQYDIPGYKIREIEKYVIEKRNYDEVYFENILSLLELNLESVDEFIEDNTDLTLSSLACIDKAILRLAFCALLYRKDIPEKVSINESISIAKKFSAEESYKFINNILDQLYKFITKHDQK